MLPQAASNDSSNKTDRTLFTVDPATLASRRETIDNRRMGRNGPRVTKTHPPHVNAIADSQDDPPREQTLFHGAFPER